MALAAQNDVNRLPTHSEFSCYTHLLFPCLVLLADLRSLLICQLWHHFTCLALSRLLEAVRGLGMALLAIALSGITAVLVESNPTVTSLSCLRTLTSLARIKTSSPGFMAMAPFLLAWPPAAPSQFLILIAVARLLAST